jgi:ABC-type glycerol-3-phosphate transport system permease component
MVIPASLPAAGGCRNDRTGQDWDWTGIYKIYIIKSIDKTSMGYQQREYGPLMAATVISTTPMLIAYFLSQKYVIKGIALSGLKG